MKPKEVITTNELGKEKKIGIYMIYCAGDEKGYIGQSKNVKNRWSVHKTHLKQN